MTSGWPTKFPENGVYTKAVHNSDHPIMEFQIFEDLLEIAQKGLVCKSKMSIKDAILETYHVIHQSWSNGDPVSNLH